MRKSLNALCFLLLFLIAACTPYMEGAGPVKTVPDFDGDYYVAADGTRLPLRVWEPQNPPKAVLLGVHGFNDYGNFVTPGFASFLQDNDVRVITYDQRGFGEGPHRGLWPGTDTLVNDLASIIHLVHSRHEDLPLYVMGESMGGAVVINTLSTITPLPVQGAILSAPAVWGPSTWPWYQKAGLYFFSYTMPWLELSGGGIVQPTDHIENWKNWSRDPLVIRGNRVDTLYGVSQAMEAALHNAANLHVPSLVLYGAKDEVIPHAPTRQMINSLPDGHRLAYYPEGWHWLTRDKNGPVVWKDILGWINDQGGALPSGMDSNARQRLQQ